MKTLSEESKPIALEKYEFEKRQKKNTGWTISHVQPINIQMFHLRNIQNYILLIQTLLKKFISVVFEKDESKYRDISILIALLPRLDNQYAKTNVMDIFHVFSNERFASSEKLSNCTLMERSK